MNETRDEQPNDKITEVASGVFTMPIYFNNDKPFIMQNEIIFCTNKNLYMVAGILELYNKKNQYRHIECIHKGAHELSVQV